MNTSRSADTARTATDPTHAELATELVQACFDPPRPDAFAQYCTDGQARFIFKSFATAFPDARFEIEWVVADDGRAVVGGRIRGTHLGIWRDVPHTGRRIDVATTLFLALADGNVVAVRSLTDSLALAEQIGAVRPLGPRACQVYDGSARAPAATR